LYAKIDLQEDILIREMLQEKQGQYNTLISVVVPVFNEQEVLPHFYKRLKAFIDDNGINAEIIFINDGGADNSFEIIRDLQKNDHMISIIELSRNFGKEIAMTAGLDHAHGEAVILIDSDLQDPPELISELIEQWCHGYDVVYAKRSERHGETVFKKVSAHLFYRVIQRMSRVQIPEDTGDYRLLSRRAVNALKQLREQHRFMKGLFSWIGYSQKAVYYQRDPRYAGKTKWNYWKLWNFALEGITSFTSVPLKIWTYFGFITAFCGFFYGLFIGMKAIFFGDPVKGFPSLIVIITLLGGMQLIGIGVLGEYIGRMFDETKNRPLYFIKDYKPALLTLKKEE
jgi:polyisoprenyl-phosphate glycosyltransferase